MYSYEQPSKDLEKIFISAPRVFVAAYSVATPPTYNGQAIVDLSNPPTGTGYEWTDAGIIEAVSMPVIKNFAHKEVGRPKARVKSVEISRVSRIEFTIAEMIPEIMALVYGFQAKNVLASTPAATTVSTGTSRTSIVVVSAAGLVVGDRICVASTEAGLINSTNRAMISAINTNTLTLTGNGFPVTPTVGYYVKKYHSIEMVDLMDTIQKRSILLFFDWLNDDSKQEQMAMWFPCVAPTEPYVPDMKGADNFADAKVGLEAYTTTQTLTDGTSKSVQAILYYFD